jgi:hypothetical protein
MLMGRVDADKNLAAFLDFWASSANPLGADRGGSRGFV